MKGAMTVLRNMRTSEFAVTFRTCYRRYCTAESHSTMNKAHPYTRIHPWKSEDEFAKDLLKNVIYNKDGIIAINKPYGIPIMDYKLNGLNQHLQLNHKIVGAVNYCVQDSLPYLARELDVPILIPCSGAEKYMSGIYIFGINEEACRQIKLGRLRTQGKFKKYWIITTRIPNEIKGKYHLAMTLKKSVLGEKKPIILTQWSNNDVKRGDVKILNIDFKVLSNSTHNLSSLIEIDASTRKWYGIRLFASTMLYSPILGDNVHGSRVQEIMGTWLKVDPFADSCWDKPKLNRQLLDLLNMKPSQQEIIPVQIHLRSMALILDKEKKHITIEAPLREPFNWTCKQLMFKIPEVTNMIANNEEKLACA